MTKLKHLTSLVLILATSFFSFAQQGSIGQDINTGQIEYATKFFHQGQTSIITLIIIIAIAIVFILLESYYKTPYLSLWRSFFSWNALTMNSKNSTAYTTTRLTIYALVGLLLSSFVIFYSLRLLNVYSPTLLFLVVLAFTFQALLNYLSYIVISKLFSQETSAKTLLYTTLLFWSILSESAYVFLVLLVFSKSVFLTKLIAILWFVFISFQFIRKLLILLKIFSEARFHLLHIILYFCAVELMPLILVFTNIKP